MEWLIIRCVIRSNRPADLTICVAALFLVLSRDTGIWTELTNA
jgi:hypothetical protein